uniref:Uncharacterized protein n=1 Tax=OCS116 cluster bacterium TaxID=2030921 RepID=A0A2A4Z4I7_9PROT
MMLKAFNIFMAYLIGCIFTAVCVALTYYLPQMAAAAEITSKNIVDMILVVTASIIIFSSPLTLIFGLFAYFKKIDSPYFYMTAGFFAIMTTLAFIPGLQGVEGDQDSLWVPFVGVIAAAAAGYIFWYLAIRRPLPKTQQA